MGTSPESQPSPGDRRAHRRALLEAPVMLDAASAYRSVRLRNVSAGGLAVTVEETLPVGTELEIYFELPIGVAVEARAVIVRSAGLEIALRFVELDKRTLIALRSFCRVSRQLSIAVASERA